MSAPPGAASGLSFFLPAHSDGGPIGPPIQDAPVQIDLPVHGDRRTRTPDAAPAGRGPR